MKRNSFTFKIGETALKFYERSKKDIDFGAVSDSFREHNFSVIQKSILDKEDRLAMLVSELRREYTPTELSTFVYSSKKYLNDMLWDSYKHGEVNLTREEFDELIKDDRVEILNLLTKLENPEVNEKKKVVAKR
jgi:hypothetical protein